MRSTRSAAGSARASGGVARTRPACAARRSPSPPPRMAAVSPRCTGYGARGVRGRREHVVRRDAPPRTAAEHTAHPRLLRPGPGERVGPGRRELGLGAAQEAGADLRRAGPQHQRRRHAAPIGDPAGRDHRHPHRVGDGGHQRDQPDESPPPPRRRRRLPRCPPASMPCATITSAPAASAAIASATVETLANQVILRAFSRATNSGG